MYRFVPVDGKCHILCTLAGVPCETVPQLSNGRITGGRSLDEDLTYSCNTGFALTVDGVLIYEPTMTRSCNASLRVLEPKIAPKCAREWTKQTAYSVIFCSNTFVIKLCHFLKFQVHVTSADISICACRRFLLLPVNQTISFSAGFSVPQLLFVASQMTSKTGYCPETWHTART